MDALDFFPEVEARALPVVGNVLEVGLDDGVGGKSAVVEVGRHIRVLAGIKHHVGELDEDGSPNGRAIELGAAPVAVEGITIDHELWLPNTAGGVGTTGVAGLLQLVVCRGVGLEQTLEGGVPIDVLIEENLENHGCVAGPLEVTLEDVSMGGGQSF